MLECKRFRKVLLVSAYFPIKLEDSVRAFVRDEAYALSRAGIELYITRWRYAGRFLSTRNLIINGIHIYGLKLLCIKSLFMGFSDLGKLPISLFPLKDIGRTWVYLSYGKQMKKIVKHHDIDIIHAHFAYPDGFIASIAKTDKPFIVSVWGYDAQSEPKSGYGCLSRPHTTYLVRETLRNADAIIASDKSHYESVIRLIGNKRKRKVYFIPPGIDTNFFNPNVNGSRVRNMLNIESNQQVVLFARHLRPVYGAEYLIQAIPHVIEKHPDVIFIFLGNGPLLASLQRLADKLKVNNYVRFLCRVPRTHMPFYYAASNIFVDPCIVGQGYASLEAMACKKPVIGFKVGQIKISDGVNGFLIKPYSVENLAYKIVELLDNQSLQKKMGEEARKHVIQHYDINKRAKRLINLYNNLAEKAI